MSASMLQPSMTGEEFDAQLDLALEVSGNPTIEEVRAMYRKLFMGQVAGNYEEVPDSANLWPIHTFYRTIMLWNSAPLNWLHGERLEAAYSRRIQKNNSAKGAEKLQSLFLLNKVELKLEKGLESILEINEATAKLLVGEAFRQFLAIASGFDIDDVIGFEVQLSDFNLHDGSILITASVIIQQGNQTMRSTAVEFQVQLKTKGSETPSGPVN